ncbi:MAG TPA: DUF535 family protein [Ramlibacter sp.]|jgi:uncharacterized protein VirK/YbjX|uniref:DUF535 family protein n=1 Tax=Ramlibacter sp. TaxID=1917967 RepID=UPI002D45C91E|nr:DUF535 family protein [Ramlibacter sp.]HZY17056.1 DUF535 family protein [Ramlibacter sp.]
MAGKTRSSSKSARGRAPSLWRGIAWALSPARRRQQGGSGLGARTLVATLRHGKPLRRWMAVVQDLRSRGLIEDESREYLRALRPSVQRHTDVPARVAQLIDHLDWMETAFQPKAFEQLARGKAVVLAELPPPRGYEAMQLQVQRPARHSPEGELLLTLSLRRSPQVQPAAQPVQIAVLAFTRIRLEGLPCLAIGGVRGQRDATGRVSATEIAQALHGWKAPVLMVRVAQELARFWGLHLVGLNPASHRLHDWRYQWRKAHRESAQRIYASYDALWEHFGAKKGPPGWVVLPLHSDEKLSATALSPEKRARQTRRADFWIRMRNLLRHEFRRHLVRQAPESRLGGITQNLGPRTIMAEPSEWDDRDFEDSEQIVPSRSMDSGPGALE